MARQRLGQHFLYDSSWREQIASAAHFSRYSDGGAAAAGKPFCWIEIGAGHGEMTEFLAATDAPVYAVELDPPLLAHLQQLTGKFPNLTVVPGDVLEIDLAAIAAGRRIRPDRVGSLGRDDCCDRGEFRRPKPAGLRLFRGNRAGSRRPRRVLRGRADGQLVTVLAPLERVDALVELLFRETTTIGVRSYQARRRTLAREFVSVETPLGAVRMKVARENGRVLNAAPEYEDCRRIAAERGVPLKQVLAEAAFAFRKRTGGQE